MLGSSHIDICNLGSSLWQCWILNPVSEARNQTRIFMDTSWVLNQLSHSKISWIFYFYLKFSVLLFFCLIFVNYFPILTLDLFCPCLLTPWDVKSSCLRSSLFSKQALIVINSLLSSAFTMFHKFWYCVFLFLFILRYFIIYFDLFDAKLFKSMLISIYLWIQFSFWYWFLASLHCVQ